ncbi:MAG: hypothetical protein ABR923_20240 [Terracidiphilus sp.]|jgi:hypothetical protein
MRHVNLTRFFQSLLPGTREWRRLKVQRRIRLRLFLQSRLPGIFAPDYVPSPPLPERTAGDVERIVKRDFRAEEFAPVMAILNEYAARFNDNPFPVRIAALKMANGSVARLRTWIEIAKSDYRDVVLPATCPSYSKIGPDLSERKRRKIFESERQQYEDWLKR